MTEGRAPPTPPHGIPFRRAVRVWAEVGLHSFGGPAGQIAVMHTLLVERYRWISERRFLHALNYCMLLPGPEAQQLATYIGWLMHGVRGGLAAGGLFVLPGFVTILALSVLYAHYAGTAVIEAIFFGIKPAVLAIVLFAMIRIGRRALANPLMVAIAAAGFVAIFFLDVAFPLVVLSAGVIGFLGVRIWAGAFPQLSDDEPASRAPGVEPPALSDEELPAARPPLRRSLRTLALGVTLWLAPVGALAILLGSAHVYTQQALLFSTAAVVTIGGAYAVLAYIAQQAVQTYGWLAPGEMLDGLGMAETTPGPLIQAVQFVGFMGAFRLAGTLDPLAAGVLAALLVTWVTFVPSFLWIFLGASYAERLRGNRRMTAALSCITAAVVGVMLNLAVWFGMHAIFGVVEERSAGPLRLFVPSASTLDGAALAIAVLAFAAIVRLRWSMLVTLAASAGAGTLFSLLVRAA